MSIKHGQPINYDNFLSNNLAEDESKLLQIYGTSDNLFDELLDVPAPSHFQSDYGKHDIFLTADNGPDDIQASTSPNLEIHDVLNEIVLKPLELVVMERTNAFRKLAPATLSTEIETVLEKAKHNEKNHTNANATPMDSVPSAMQMTTSSALSTSNMQGTLDNRATFADPKTSCWSTLDELLDEAQTHIENSESWRFQPEKDSEFLRRSAKQKVDRELLKDDITGISEIEETGASSSEFSSHVNEKDSLLLEIRNRFLKIHDLTLEFRQKEKEMILPESLPEVRRYDGVGLMGDCVEFRAERERRLHVLMEKTKDDATAMVEQENTSKEKVAPGEPPLEAILPSGNIDFTEPENAPSALVTRIKSYAESSMVQPDAIEARSPVLPSLYAFEWGPTLEENNILEEWDNLIDKLNQQNLTNDTHESIKDHDDVLLEESKLGEPTINAPIVQEGTFAAAAKKHHLKSIEEVLASINTMEERDRLMEERVHKIQHSDPFEAHPINLDASAEIVKNNKRRLRKDRARRGLLVLEDFVKVSDLLIPPSEEETLERNRLGVISIEETVPTSEQQQQHPTETREELSPEVYADLSLLPGFEMETAFLKGMKLKSESLEAIQRRSRQNLALAQAELREYQCMCMEDERVSAFHLAQKEHAEMLESEISFTLQTEAALRETLKFIENSIREEIRNQFLRRCEAVSTIQITSSTIHFHYLFSKIIQEDTTLRDAIEEEEQMEFQGITTCLQREVRNIFDRHLQRIEKAREFFMAQKSMFDAFPMQPSTGSRIFPPNHLSSSLSQSPPLTASDNSSLSLEFQRIAFSNFARFHGFIHEWKEVRLFTTSSTRKLAASRPMLEEVLAGKKGKFSNDNHGGNMPAAPSVQGCDSNSFSVEQKDDDSTKLVLNSRAFFKLLPPLLHNVRWTPHLARVMFRSLVFSLEKITCIDIPSLAAASVVSSHPAFETNELRVSPLVKDLDLSSNALQDVPLRNIMQLFPSLRSLKLNDNQIQTLSEEIRSSHSSRGVRAVQQQAIADESCLSFLDLSMNSIQSLSEVGTLLYRSLTTFAAYCNKLTQISSLSMCTFLEKIEVYKNNIQCVADEVSTMPFLQHLNICDNQVSNINALAENNFFLQQLFASRNKITSFSPRRPMLFLNQLFLNNNHIESITNDNFPCMPFLTVLHLENNRLKEIHGLSKCSRLTHLKLEHNLIPHLSDLGSLAACKGLLSLSINDNPFSLYNADPHTSSVPSPNLDASAAGSIPSTGSISALVRSVVLIMFPCLNELNKESITYNDRKVAAETICQYPELRNLFLRFSFSYLDTSSSMLNSELMGSEKASFLPFHTLSNSYALSWFDGSPLLFHAHHLCSNSINTYISCLRSEYEIQRARRQNRYFNIISQDEIFLSKVRRGEIKESSACVRLLPLASVSEEVEQLRKETLVHLEYLMRLYRETPTRLTEIPNRVYRSSRYAETARYHREVSARRAIECWILRVVSKNRNKTKLEQEREKALKEQDRKRDLAARKIQPIWRGAALRARLRRVFYPHGKGRLDGDLDEFAKVNITDFDVEIPQGEGLAALLSRVMETKEPVPSFQIDPVVALLAKHSGSVNPQDGSSLQTRTHSAPSEDTHMSHSLLIQHQEGSSRAPRPTSTDLKHSSKWSIATSSPPNKSDNSIKANNNNNNNNNGTNPNDDEWGSAMAVFAQRKKKKMNRVHQDYIKAEFMKDPLRIKREQKQN